MLSRLSSIFSIYHSLRLSHGILLDILAFFIVSGLVLNIVAKLITRLNNSKPDQAQHTNPIKSKIPYRIGLRQVIRLSFYCLISLVTLIIFGSSIEKSLAIDFPLVQGVKIINQDLSHNQNFDTSRPNIYLISPIGLSVEKVNYPITLDKIYIDYGQNLYWRDSDSLLVTLADQGSIDSIERLKLSSPLIIEDTASENNNRRVYILDSIDSVDQLSKQPESSNLSIILATQPIKIYQFKPGKSLDN